MNERKLNMYSWTTGTYRIQRMQCKEVFGLQFTYFNSCKSYLQIIDHFQLLLFNRLDALSDWSLISLTSPPAECRALVRCTREGSGLASLIRIAFATVFLRRCVPPLRTWRELFYSTKGSSWPSSYKNGLKSAVSGHACRTGSRDLLTHEKDFYIPLGQFQALNLWIVLCWVRKYNQNGGKV